MVVTRTKVKTLRVTTVIEDLDNILALLSKDHYDSEVVNAVLDLRMKINKAINTTGGKNG